MPLFQRKQTVIQGLDKGLPLQIRKLISRPDNTVRLDFNDANQGNTADNTYAYDEFVRPIDNADPRVTSLGTVYVTNSGATFAEFIFELAGDYREMFNGILRFFLETASASDAGKAFSVEIASSEADLGVNSDVYTLEAADTAPSTVPYIVDLSSAPSSVNGTGFDKTDATGFAVKIALDVDFVGIVGFSTLDIFGDVSSLTPDLIKLYCLDALSINRTYEVIDNPCAELVGISDKTVEFSVTVRSETPDLYKAMVDAVYTEDTTVLRKKELTRTVEAFTDPDTGVSYGAIGLQGITENTEAPVDVLVTTQLRNGAPVILTEVTTHSPNQAIIGSYFYVARGTYSTAVNNKILFDADYVGEEVLVTYYEDATGLMIEETNDFRNVLAAMWLDLQTSDGIRTYEFPIAVVTGLNQPVGEADPMTWEMTIQVPEKDGVFIRQHIPNPSAATVSNPIIPSA